MQWDIFCRVIDNFGDIGVCWRLCADLAGRGHQVRLWVDDSSALEWMAPGALDGAHAGIQVLPWRDANSPDVVASMPCADVWVEGFGCEIPDKFVERYTAHCAYMATQAPCWINLEYLSAESYVERAHGLPSPVMSGPAKGWTKHFYYPGFTPSTGGLLREPQLLEQIAAWDDAAKAAWLKAQGIAWRGESLVSLFCYEPEALAQTLQQLADQPAPTLLLVTAGRASKAVDAHLARPTLAASLAASALRVHFLPPVSQHDYDRLLWSCDLNFVRGEDSVVRALWAGKPLVWNIYPQDDLAHAPKLEAFLDLLEAPPSLRRFHQHWNGLTGAPNNLENFAALAKVPSPAFPDLAAWQRTAHSARQRLAHMQDLTSQLVEFVAKKR